MQLSNSVPQYDRSDSFCIANQWALWKLVKAIGPERGLGSDQAAFWSANKLSGGSASGGVNRGSKRYRVPQ